MHELLPKTEPTIMNYNFHFSFMIDHTVKPQFTRNLVRFLKYFSEYPFFESNLEIWLDVV